VLGRSLTGDEAREVRNTARRVAALRLLEPLLDANYDAARRSGLPRTAPARSVLVPRSFHFALALLCAAVLLAGCGNTRLFPEGSPASGEEVRVTVSRVVDGDTVGITPAVGGNDTVRLIAWTPRRGGSRSTTRPPFSPRITCKGSG
jgi:hypothetical protein